MQYQSFCRVCPTNAHCCTFKNKSGFTFVGIEDAKKIKSETKKDYNESLDFSPLSEDIVAFLKDDDPSLEGAMRNKQLDKQNRLLRLKTKKDGTCIFLDKNRRCTIYDIRPNICRIFPFWAMKLNNGKIKIIEHDEKPKCGIIKSKNKEFEDIEDSLSDNEVKEIKKIFGDIIKENKHYKKNIRRFAKTI